MRLVEMETVMRQNMTDWLLDCVFDYLTDGDLQEIDGDELQNILFSFVNEEFDMVRSQFGDIPVGEIDEIIDNVVQVVREGGFLSKKKYKYSYQTLDVYGDPIIKDTNDFLEARNNYVWGTTGKMGQDPLKFVKLVDCTTEHLKNIIATQKQISHFTYRVIQDILHEREVSIKLDEDLFVL